MKHVHVYLSLAVLLIVTAYLISPVLAQDAPPAEPDRELKREVEALQEKVAGLERLVGQERETRPSLVLRIRSLELSVDELERDSEEDDGDGAGDGRAVRDLTRRVEANETRLERLDRNRFGALERRMDAAEREIRSLETRVRRLE